MMFNDLGAPPKLPDTTPAPRAKAMDAAKRNRSIYIPDPETENLKTRSRDMESGQLREKYEALLKENKILKKQLVDFEKNQSTHTKSNSEMLKMVETGKDRYRALLEAVSNMNIDLNNTDIVSDAKVKADLVKLEKQKKGKIDWGNNHAESLKRALVQMSRERGDLIREIERGEKQVQLLKANQNKLEKEIIRVRNGRSAGDDGTGSIRTTSQGGSSVRYSVRVGTPSEAAVTGRSGASQRSSFTEQMILDAFDAFPLRGDLQVDTDTNENQASRTVALYNRLQALTTVLSEQLADSKSIQELCSVFSKGIDQINLWTVDRETNTLWLDSEKKKKRITVSLTDTDECGIAGCVANDGEAIVLNGRVLALETDFDYNAQVDHLDTVFELRENLSEQERNATTSLATIPIYREMRKQHDELPSAVLQVSKNTYDVDNAQSSEFDAFEVLMLSNIARIFINKRVSEE